ncbi:MAG TPA: serine hydrolase domain-containing protein [Gammaproteobacteria bacterium]|jgi:CubicO group peptidase (beta-lactamase class C family)
MKSRTIPLGALTAGLMAPALLSAAELADPAAIERFLESEVAARNLPGLVALVTDEDEVIYVSAHGQRNVAGGLPMTTDTIFRIASMTKPIAAAAIMMLVEEGRLSLDAPIGDYVEEYADARVITGPVGADGSFSTRPAAQPITIRHLLSHSSGLAYGFASDTVTALNAAGVNGADVPLLYDPGEAWSYAGGIAIVGRVLEEIEGIGLDEFLGQRLFEPLGMTDTSFAVPTVKNERVTTTHGRDDTGALIENPNADEIRSAPSGDGGLNSTAGDYSRFIQLILNDGVAPDGQRLLRPESVAELGRNQLGDVRVSLQDEPNPALARAFPLGAGRDGFGLGFQVTGAHEDPDVRTPGSMSWAGIFNTEFWIDPASGIGAVLLMQYLPFYDADAIELLQAFEARIYSELR